MNVTRLAPSPTGALHLGNARTFLVNWAMARQRGWRIVLRIEDLDGPRVKPGAAAAAMEILRWLGVDWDEGPHVQSDDLEPYRRAMESLARGALAYPSEHTRADLARLDADDVVSAPQEGAQESHFPAALRPELQPRAFDRPDSNWRFVTPAGPVPFADEFAGPQTPDPARTVGDFIIWTKRAQPAYQLAVVVDDARQGVTHIVRGDDLLDSAARQLLIYRALGLGPEPRYCHLPLVRGPDGRRLAKRHGDTRVETYRGRGVSASRIIGLLARWSGIVADRCELSAREYRERFDLNTMSRSAITHTPEDDAWLYSART